jgi:ATP-dependent DNA helicase RecQ
MPATVVRATDDRSARSLDHPVAVTLDLTDIRAAARVTLGHRSLLPGQAEAIQAVSSGRDTLALLPTGGGKSAIYQLAGISIEGPTVVVSPLIALQRDQLEGLRELGLPAAALNSTVPAGERDGAVTAFSRGELEFLLLAPEQLSDEVLLERLAAAHPSLFVVDEAHCVAEWGRDFRPEYRRLGAVADALGRPPILALTATASPLLRAEIVERLGLREPAMVAHGFDRPNLTLSVDQRSDEVDKRRAVVARASELDGSGIVYVGTRRAAEEIAEALDAAGVAAAPYHAGLAARRRHEIQDGFMGGRLRVIVATTAFGMGIDKPDVRFVLHHDVAESLDGYHQEIGRAGRDGEPAAATLFYRAADLGLRRYQAAPARFEEADVRRVVRTLRREPGLDIPGVAGRAKLSRRRTDAVVGRLEELAAVTVASDGRLSMRDDIDADAGLAAAVVAGQERRRTVERSRVEMMRMYAEAPGCRRVALLGYFGEPFEPPCANCDHCLAAESDASSSRRVDRGAVAAGDGRLAVEDRVRHPTFGVGLVTGLADGIVTVAFEDVGYRTLDAGLVAAEGLLVPVDA